MNSMFSFELWISDLKHTYDRPLIWGKYSAKQELKKRQL